MINQLLFCVDHHIMSALMVRTKGSEQVGITKRSQKGHEAIKEIKKVQQDHG